ncbi:mRNA cap guanine-N7 methyltransferase [Coelomomyces lativittatus]|nr:mRNA cap guanine-N7 methyltransferase [Coelomomyces lativittatus]
MTSSSTPLASTTTTNPNPHPHPLTPLPTPSSSSSSSTHTVASHYNALRVQSLAQRTHSIIYHLRCFNNWVKALLVHDYVPFNAYVLDLGCGRGGDLMKYHRAQIKYLLGLDIAETSIEEARHRYHSSKYFKFKAEFHITDCFNHPIDPYVPDSILFDAVCMQFSLHYTFSSENTARQTFQNVSKYLKPGGYFFGCTTHSYLILKKALTLSPSYGNSFYSVHFSSWKSTSISPYGHQYTFQLDDAIEGCPEYLIHWATLESLASSYGLDLIERVPFHDFYQRHGQTHQSLLIHMNVLNLETPQLSDEEWEAIGLYTTFVFQKKKETGKAS